MTSRMLAPVVIGGILLLALSGCGTAKADPSTPTPTPTPTPTRSATPTPTAEPGAAALRLPTTCTDLVPGSRIAAFEAAGLELLGGPGGRYGEDYLLEPTPEEEAGGMTCIWGDEAIPQSTVTVSVAPVTTANRARIVDDLIAQGLNEAETGDALTYAELGDEVSAPAILNVVRRESWISVIEALGGEERFAEAAAIADEVAVVIYPVD